MTFPSCYFKFVVITTFQQHPTGHFFSNENTSSVESKRNIQNENRETCNMSAALPVMHMAAALLSFLWGELISGGAIRNKQVVEPTSHVFNLLLCAQPAIVRQIRTDPLIDMAKRKLMINVPPATTPCQSHKNEKSKGFSLLWLCDGCSQRKENNDILSFSVFKRGEVKSNSIVLHHPWREIN